MIRRFRPTARFGLFLAAGTAGFVTDATVFFLLLHGIGFAPAACRIAASAIATVVTWSLNRSFAFRAARSEAVFAEFAKYALASAGGALANLLTLLAALPYDPSDWHAPAYAAGTAAGLVVNYVLYDRLVFPARAGRDP